MRIVGDKFCHLVRLNQLQIIEREVVEVEVVQVDVGQFPQIQFLFSDFKIELAKVKWIQLLELVQLEVLVGGGRRLKGLQIIGVISQIDERAGYHRS